MTVYVKGESSIPCWRWSNGALVPSELPIPEGVAYIWEAITQLGYSSVCQYTQEPFPTYLYRQFDDTTPIDRYLVATSMDGNSQELERATVELVRLPDWPSVLTYLGSLLPIITPAIKSDRNWDAE